MPHVAFITLAGFRIVRESLRERGLSLPGFAQRAEALAQLPALGLLTLAGMLPEDWSCSYHSPRDLDDALRETIIAERPDLVAISALTASIEEAYRLSDALRQRGVQTVLGGLHVTTCADEAARHADAVVVGAAESVWLDVIDDARRRTLQPKYIAKRQAPPRHAVSVEWPLPRFDLLGDDITRWTVQTQQGCPLACTFCAASRLLGPYREKPVDRLRQELQLITARDPAPLIELADDNTFAERHDAAEMLDVLRASGAKWFTESDWRVGERPEVLGSLAASGCVQLLVGIESIIFRYPGMGAKQAETDRMLDSVRAIQDAGVAVNGCFIVGAEGETPQSIDRLTEYLLESPFAEVQVTLETPFPGTALRSRMEREGRLLTERGWSYYNLFDVTHQPDEMSVSQLERRFEELIGHVYGAAATRRRQRLRRDIWRRNARLH